MDCSFFPGFLSNSESAEPTSVHPSEDAGRDEAEKACDPAEDFPPVPAVGPRFDSPAPHDGRATVISAAEETALLQSFDMILRLNQRGEETRRILDRIDDVVLTSRTVAGLTERILGCVADQLDLVAVRILVCEDHPIASIIRSAGNPGLGLVPWDLLDNEGSFSPLAFVLDNPSGDLSRLLFGEGSSRVSSAAVVQLCCPEESFGLLCLGSDDPLRYCGSTDTDLVAAIAARIALGLKNASDHEVRVRSALFGGVRGLYNEIFFNELLLKEVDRAWRYQTTFSVTAVSWDSRRGDEIPPGDEITAFIISNIRSSDVAARGDAVKLWVLLPHTSAQEAFILAQRLINLATARFSGRISVKMGITEFSKNCPAQSVLLAQAKSALEEAEKTDRDPIVVRHVPEPIAPRSI